MGKVFVDKERLSIELPDGFAAMEPAQLQALYGMDYAEMWGARDAERHAALTVIWKDSGAFLTKLASEKALAERVQKTLAKHYADSGYRFGAYFETEVAGRAACGFTCSFTQEGIPHESEVTVFKDGGRCYTMYYYTRDDAAARNRAVYEAMRASLALG